MSTIINKNFSSATATIKFDDFEVGELQNISVEENYDVRPLPEIGKSYIVAFVPGVFKGSLRAQKGVLSVPDILSKMLTSVNTNVISSEITAILSDSKISPSVGRLKSFSTVQETLDHYVSLMEEKVKYPNDNHIIAFDVEIKDIDEEVFMKLTNCVINSRRTTIDQGNLLVMQDVEISYKQRIV